MKFSAGGVVIGPNRRIVVVNQNGDSWSLPKGHIDDGENAEEAATREIYEESGIQDILVIRQLGEYERSRIGLGGEGYDESETKHITMFLCTTDQEHLQPVDSANPTAEWLPIENVADRLSHPADKAFFQSVVPEILKFLASTSTSSIE